MVWPFRNKDLDDFQPDPLYRIIEYANSLYRIECSSDGIVWENETRTYSLLPAKIYVDREIRRQKHRHILKKRRLRHIKKVYYPPKYKQEILTGENNEF